METGAIPIGDIDGGFDCYLTLESGQSYLWDRSDGRMYSGSRNGEAWYHIVLDEFSQPYAESFDISEPTVVRVRQRDGYLEWESSIDATACIEGLLRLDDDLDHIADSAPDDPLISAAFDTHRGMRLVGDPSFGSLISFICSSQMRVERIHRMAQTLSRTHGRTIEFDGERYHTFPRPERLADSSESRLRSLKLGYRAPYVIETARMVTNGQAHPEMARDLPYEEARSYLTRFVGVGEKVADCVLLFSLGYLEAVPLDTWIRKTIAQYYPDCDCGGYTETSRAIRDRLGGKYAGYTQTYIFHYLRHNGNESESSR